MAVLQLSRITNRKGLSEDLPQLAGAEFGWVLDERKLYIGNGTIVDGAPVVGNTEILTEFSDILALAGSYTYQGSAAGYVVKTGVNDSDIVRSLQRKFDDIASVKDFGAVGDGVTDDTAAINRALYELFCREVNAEIRRSLFFPAGTYRVSSKIKVPPHAKLHGEGLTSSIINFVSATAVAADSIVAGQRYAITTVGDTDFVSIGAGSDTVDVVFVATAAGAGTGTARAVDDTVVETADSLQQTGANIGNNSATTPTGIEMLSMAVYSQEENTLLKLDSVTNSGFHYIGLHGPHADPTDVGYSTSAIEIATSAGATSDVTISKLDTYGTTYGLRVAGNAKGIVLENSGLDLHYKGVLVTNELIDAVDITTTTRYKIMALGTSDFTAIGAEYNRVGQTFSSDVTASHFVIGVAYEILTAGTTDFTAIGAANSLPTTVFIATGRGEGTGTAQATATPAGTGKVIAMDDAGPTGVVISRNIFDNIAYQGIHFENVLFNSSGYNVFYDVGNGVGGTPTSAVITMDTDQCVSIGDLFEREDETVKPRIELNGNGGVYIDGTHSIHLGSYERQLGLEAIIAAGVTNETVIFNLSEAPNSYRVDYNIRDDADTNARMGTITISATTSITAITYHDEYSQTGDLGIVLTAVQSANALDSNSELQVTSTGGSATMNFSVVRLD